MVWDEESLILRRQQRELGHQATMFHLAIIGAFNKDCAQEFNRITREMTDDSA